MQVSLENLLKIGQLKPHTDPSEPAVARESFGDVALVRTPLIMQKNRAIHWALCDDIFKTKPDALN